MRGLFIRFEYVEDGKVGILALVWHEVRAPESALWLRADDGVEGNGFRCELLYYENCKHRKQQGHHNATFSMSCKPRSAKQRRKIRHQAANEVVSINLPLKTCRNNPSFKSKIYVFISITRVETTNPHSLARWF